jgi:hypothetical protein
MAASSEIKEMITTTGAPDGAPVTSRMPRRNAPRTDGPPSAPKTHGAAENLPTQAWPGAAPPPRLGASARTRRLAAAGQPAPEWATLISRAEALAAALAAVRTGIVHRPPGRLGDELDRAMIRLQAEAREFAARFGVPEQYPARITAAAPPAVAARPHTAAPGGSAPAPATPDQGRQPAGQSRRRTRRWVHGAPTAGRPAGGSRAA